jgi:hypothetical protein
VDRRRYYHPRLIESVEVEEVEVGAGGVDDKKGEVVVIRGLCDIVFNRYRIHDSKQLFSNIPLSK